MKDAGFNRYRILKCNDPTEIVTAKYLRAKYFNDTKDPYIDTFYDSTHAHLILYKGCDIIGYTHIQFLSNNHVIIYIITIDEDKKTETIGGIFLSFIETWLKSLEIKIIHAISQDNCLNFFLKNNYKIILPKYDNHEIYKSTINDIIVSKIL